MASVDARCISWSFDNSSGGLVDEEDEEMFTDDSDDEDSRGSGHSSGERRSEEEDEANVQQFMRELESPLTELSALKTFQENSSSLSKSLWPVYHGGGFYRSVALMNHSCQPNVKVKVD